MSPRGAACGFRTPVAHYERAVCRSRINAASWWDWHFAVKLHQNITIAPAANYFGVLAESRFQNSLTGTPLIFSSVLMRVSTASIAIGPHVRMKLSERDGSQRPEVSDRAVGTVEHL